MNGETHIPRVPEPQPGDRRGAAVRWLKALRAGEIKGGPG